MVDFKGSEVHLDGDVQEQSDRRTWSFRKEVSIFPPQFVPRVSVGNRCDHKGEAA